MSPLRLLKTVWIMAGILKCMRGWACLFKEMYTGIVLHESRTTIKPKQKPIEFSICTRRKESTATVYCWTSGLMEK
jgi:hypothetical protein